MSEENQIYILGPKNPCQRCRTTKQMVADIVAKEFTNKNVKIENLELGAPETVAKFGVLKSPAVVINNNVVSEGEVPKKEYLLKAMKELIK
jgi:hypothetical protein